MNTQFIKITAASLVLPFLLASCASQGTYMAIPDSKGGMKMGKVMGNSGDWTGNIKYEQRGSVVKIEITQPTGDIPMMQQAIVHKGKLVGYNQVPIMAGINNSRVNEAMWGGISKTIRSLSNLVGTVIAGMIGIESAKQIGGAVTAWAPKEATQAAAPAIPAAGSATHATVPATVVPDVLIPPVAP